MPETQERYPALMAYIAVRSPNKDWCSQLRIDERAAFEGGLADVARELEQAQADYKAQQAALGFDGYPYNSAMGTFLGLPIRSNNEPPSGYYMACRVANHYRYGNATREVRSLLDGGATLRVVSARSKATGEPVRFHTFRGSEVSLEGTGVVATNGRVRVRLDSNWSTETCMESVARALRTGEHYGATRNSGVLC